MLWRQPKRCHLIKVWQMSAVPTAGAPRSELSITAECQTTDFRSQLPEIISSCVTWPSSFFLLPREQDPTPLPSPSPPTLAKMPGIIQQPQTLYDKVLESHIVNEQSDGTLLLYIDRHLVHEVTSPVRLMPIEALAPTHRESASIRGPE